MSPHIESEDGILQFRELRRSVDRASHLVLYEAYLGARTFTYLYLRRSTCSLVWKSPSQFQFKSTLPFEFLETQFGEWPHTKIELDARSLPWYGSSMLHKRYKLKKCLVTLVLTDEARLLEYDLSEPKSPESDKYSAEIVQNKEAIAAIAFARFDFELIYDKKRFISYSLSVERLDDPAGQTWEFAINVPRDLELKDATLKWIVRQHHFSREMRTMKFEESLVELHKMIKPQKEPIYA